MATFLFNSINHIKKYYDLSTLSGDNTKIYKEIFDEMQLQDNDGRVVVEVFINTGLNKEPIGFAAIKPNYAISINCDGGEENSSEIERHTINIVKYLNSMYEMETLCEKTNEIKV